MWMFLFAAMLADTSGGKPAAAPRVSLTTSKGEIVIELYPDKAQKSV